jgi:hypothetical protein
MVFDLLDAVGSALQLSALPVGKGKETKTAARHGIVLLFDPFAIIVCKRSHFLSP